MPSPAAAPVGPATEPAAGGSPQPSPPEASTDGSFLPEIFWKPRSLGAVSAVVAVWDEVGLKLLKKPAPAIGVVLDRWVILADCGAPPWPIV